MRTKNNFKFILAAILTLAVLFNMAFCAYAADESVDREPEASLVEQTSESVDETEVQSEDSVNQLTGEKEPESDLESSSPEQSDFATSSLDTGEDDPYPGDDVIGQDADLSFEENGEESRDQDMIGESEFMENNDETSGEMTAEEASEDIVGAANGKIVQVSFALNYDQTGARQMMDFVNDFRTGSEAWAYGENGKKDYASYKGLGKLKYDYGLEKVALQRAAQIALYNVHSLPDGGESQSLTINGIKSDGENLCAGYGDNNKTAAQAVESLKETQFDYEWQGHRRTMLGRGYTAFAAAHVYVEKNLDQRYGLSARTDYWVQLFRTKSPSGNSIVMTEAINGKQIRTVDVMENFVTRKDIEVPGSDTMTVGTSKKLPDVKQYIATTEMFPQTFQYKLKYGGSSEILSYDNMIELNGDFSWSSSNPSVVEIIGKKMYARKAGKAVLTVSTPLNSASVTVAVKAAPTATPQPTATPKPTKTPTPKPTATPKPTKTPTPKPTATPKPTKTPTPKPTATPKPTKTPTPKPTATPKPTKTPTPKPTTTPKPTKMPTPKPTVTPKPTKTPTPKPTTTPKPTKTPTPKLVPVYRLFNTRTGEHFYTAKVQERKEYLMKQNWRSEGIAWYAPEISNEPIYRVSNPNNGNEHHYTKSISERNWLVSLGWKDEGIAWYSDPSKKVPIYRHYHPKQRTGNHHYTTSKGESDHIVKYEGWNYEGIAFYVSKAGG